MGLKTGLKERTPKGEISIDNNNGRLRLRWRYKGKRFSLHLSYSYSQENLPEAKIKAAEIKLDILKGCLDTSLIKYQDIAAKPIPTDTTQVKSSEIHSEIPVVGQSVYLNDLVKDFSYWAKNIKNINVEESHDYLYTRRLLEKWVMVPVDEIAEKMNAESWMPTTYNRRITCLSNFFIWLQKKGSLIYNPLEGVRKRKDSQKRKKASRKPLEEYEILQLLEAIKNDTYCSSLSRHKHSHYYPFLLFMFLTGVRNAEAVGLRMCHISFDEGHIEISETFARTIKGTSHTARIRKATKTENIRYIPLTDELKELLLPLISVKKKDDFVFTSPKGLSIDDHRLGTRILKPVLKKLNIADRDLYCARHSFGTRSAQQGLPVTDIAYLMGHNTIKTAINNYISVDKPTKKLPTLKLT